MFVRWNLTVCSARNSSFAICLFDRPDWSACRIVSSRLLRSASLRLPLLWLSSRPSGWKTARSNAFRLAHDLDVVALGERETNCVKHEPMVIGNQDLEPPHSSPPVCFPPNERLGAGAAAFNRPCARLDSWSLSL